MTDKRACDVELSLRVDSASLRVDIDEDDDDDDLGDAFEDVEETSEDREVAAASNTAVPSIMDWISFGVIKTSPSTSESPVPTAQSAVPKPQNSEIKEPKLLRSASADSAIAVPLVAHRNPTNMLWDHERSAMQKRIAELEVQNRVLEAKLSEQH
jgi:hypothetical protein